MDATNNASAGVPISIEEFKKADHKKKIRFGLIMGIFCALYWGVWYVPGYAIWGFDSFLYPDMSAKGISSDLESLLDCLFLTCINATACALVLFIWNGALGKLREWKRTLIEVKAASKYFMLAGLCGACAVYGTYIASTFLSPGFAAVAGLLYPIIGTIMSVLYLKQKVSKRGYLSIIVLLAGGITLYAGSMITGGSVGGNATLGAIGGYPMLDTIGQIANPSVFLAVLLIGLSFAWCYVTWYKSFPFLGVARGQAVGSLYAACAVIFLIIFFGPVNALGYDDDSMLIIVGSTIAGLIICLIGSFLIATEDTEGMVSLKDTSKILGGDKE